MKSSGCALALCLALTFNSYVMTMAQTQNLALPKPPVAKKVEKKTEVGGEVLIDNYSWLREKGSAEVNAYLEAENAYTAAVMKPTEAFQESLYKEMVARIKETDENVPYRFGDYFYYTRTVKGLQYPIYARKKELTNSPEQIILDQNEMAKGLKFFDLGDFSVSNDGNLLAYTTDTTGFRQYVLHFKDLRTGEVLPDTAERVTSVAWANDNRTLFYTVEDPVAKRSHRFYRHTLGQKTADELLYDEKDELYRLDVERSRSRQYVFLTSHSFNSTEVRYVAADKPQDAPRVILPREAMHRYYADHHGDFFYIRTNEGAKNFRLVSAPVNDPAKKNWKEILPHRKDVLLADTNFFKDYWVAVERENGLQKFRITDFKTGKSHYVEFPEPVYSANSTQNYEFDTNKLRFNYQSFITSSSVFDYNMETKERTLLKQTEVLGGYDPKLYLTERVYAVAPDGVRVPVSLVYKKDLKRDGQRPLLLYAYGAYGYPSNVAFSSSRLSLLDRGMVFAIAHIRGGGEMGEPWHDQGKMMMKRNTFTDFIAAAEHLVREKYTSKDRLAIMGGSAGGLLIGAVVNMRPDLFKIAVLQVPFVDVINTMLDETLPLTVGEFQEWGNPKIKKEYDYMRSYSPYENIEAKAYPTILVRTSLNDSQVMYWEPAKYVARLRSLKTDNNPLLFRIKMEPAGHGGASGRYDALRDTAFDYAFILSQLGITK